MNALTSGTRIGSYEITARIGAGGMGEVYRARDGKLNRDVAIKLLPADVAADRDRLARFEREAQTLAALNHPNIAQIFGVVEEPPALVMEFVDGEDLAARLVRGRIPLDEALPIARQIADALEAAHDQGIVHRDLKPANIKVRPDGTVKVLDFGLAKAMDPTAGSGAAIANSPTFTAQHTQVGMIVGTAAYMAPEQARGKAVDRRADIWAFGAVLYEMLSGRRAFDGEDISDVLASVLKSDPAWNAVPADVPPSIRRLLRRCLEKDPRKRLSAIGDARFDLDEPEPAAQVTLPAARRGALPYAIVALTAALLTAAVAWLWLGRATPAAAAVQRTSLLPPAGVAMYPDSGAVAISPDGSMVAFVSGGPMKTNDELWVRSLDSLEARRLEGVTGARLPFWSPDSRTIGYVSDNRLMTVPAAGGRPQVVTEMSGPGRGATWNANVILFAPDTVGALYRVNASGGTPVQVTTLDASRRQYGHRFPVFLPDGDHFIYAALPAHNGKFDVFAAALSGGAPVLIGAMDDTPVYADGYLLTTRQGVLVAQPFDATSLKLTGDPVTLGDAPSVILERTISYTAGHTVSVAANGTLAYYTSPSQNTTADWYDASGRRTGTLALPPGHYDSVHISPDGTQAIAVRAVSPSQATLWLVDLARGGAVLVTNAAGLNDSPIWSPDGSRILFASDRDGISDFYLKKIGSDEPEQLFYRSAALFKGPDAWSPDGKWIVVNQLDPVTAQNVWLLPVDDPRELKPLVMGPKRDGGSAVAPDSRWLSYLSDETGRMQVYVMPFPGGGRRVQVSQDGAQGAAWTRDGRALLFTGVDGKAVWRVPVTIGTSFTAGTPEHLGDMPGPLVDITPDGRRFLVLLPDATGTESLTVVRNWRSALAR